MLRAAGSVPARTSSCLRVASMSSFKQFLAENKLWWITPIVIVAALVAYVLITGSGGEGAGDSPFEYDQY